MYQRERVLRALRQRGAHGLTRIDFLEPTIDGGDAILNIPARIFDLKRRGYAIDTLDERRNGCEVYVLGTEQSRAIVDSALGPAAQPSPAPEPDQLFAGVQVGRGQRSAIFGDEEAA